MLETSHRPDGKMADALASTLACACLDSACANASVNYSWYVPQRPSKLPIAPMGRWLTCPNRLSSFNSDRYLVLSGRCTCLTRLQTSHRPDGKMPCPNGIFTCFALVLAGRRCLCREWHGKLRVVHHHWQLSYLCACSAQNFPSPRWEDC